MENQATINIGTLGHVSHGKSTLTKALTGTKTMKHSSELINSLTIKLGYANFKIFKCNICPEPKCYHHMDCNIKETELNCPDMLCQGQLKLIRHISITDCPGHQSLMATMLSGAAIMDAAILVIAANQPVPQPQTAEHLSVADMLGIRNMIIVQNKVDLVNKEDAKKNYQDILKFIKGTVAEGKPIIPISSVHEYNIDVVLQYIDKYIQYPEKNIEKPPILDIVRSFDINKCGSKIDDIKGGVVGGTLKQGVLKIGQEIEIRPGVRIDNKCVPLRSKIISLYSEKNKLECAESGGLIAVGTEIDPFLSKNDMIIGQVVGIPEHMPNIYQSLKIEFHKMKYLDQNDLQINLVKNETIKINCGSLMTLANIENIQNGNKFIINLEKPVCTDLGKFVSVSKRIENKWKLIGYGIIIQ